LIGRWTRPGWFIRAAAYPRGRALIHSFACSSAWQKQATINCESLLVTRRRYYCGNPVAAPERTISATTFLRAPPDRERDLSAAPVDLGIAELWPGQDHGWVPVDGPLGPCLHRGARRTSQRLGDTNCPLVQVGEAPCKPTLGQFSGSGTDSMMQLRAGPLPAAHHATGRPSPRGSRPGRGRAAGGAGSPACRGTPRCGFCRGSRCRRWPFRGSWASMTSRCAAAERLARAERGRVERVHTVLIFRGILSRAQVHHSRRFA
jgi:hypothetical protein